MLYNTNMTKRDFPRPAEDWTLFCPNEAFDSATGKGLMDLWGEDFERPCCGMGRWTAEREDRMTYEFHDFGRFNVFP